MEDLSDARLSRREFAVASTLVVGLAGAGTAEAQAGVSQRNVEIKTPDGTCDAVLIAPTGKKSAAVILYPDAFGLRPAMVDMGRRIAGDGYAVLVVNQFYRSKKAPVMPAGASFSDRPTRTELGKLMGALNHDTAIRDGGAFVDFLKTAPEVNTKAKMGAVGFCMGGAMVIRVAVARPDAMGAGASFHGGGLVAPNDPNSPHTLVGKTKSSYHFGIAAGDDANAPNDKTVLADALKAAGRPYTMEVYPGTKHGWTVTDSEVYDKPQAERAYAAMLKLYKSALV